MKNHQYCPNCFNPIEYTLSDTTLKKELTRRLFPQAEEFKYLEDKCELCNRPLPIDPVPHTPRSCPACHQPTTILEKLSSIFETTLAKH